MDVALVATLLYALIVWLREARALLALVGIAIVGVIYLLVRQLGLVLVAGILQAFAAVFLLLVVILFQVELRQFFERLALWGLGRGAAGSRTDAPEIIARCAADLASERWGALIVLPGRDPIERHVSGGIPLDARLSAPLLLSLFDPSSPGHDGAVVITGSRARSFAVHLPLSSDHAQLRNRGTRHAAALGLAERTDALCIAVSEERGTVSVARNGRLEPLAQPSELMAILRAAREPAAPDTGVRRATATLTRFRSNWRELGSAIGLALLLWVLVIPGSQVTSEVVRAAVEVENLPDGYRLAGIEPEQVDVTVEGLRRDLFLVDGRRLRVVIDGFPVRLGRRTFQLAPDSVHGAGDLSVEEIEPTHVRLSVERTSASAEPDEAESP